jgi:hypothetical protein
MARKDFLPRCSTYHEMARCENKAEVMLQCDGKDNPFGWVCCEHAAIILAEYAKFEYELDLGHWTARELDEYGR